MIIIQKIKSNVQPLSMNSTPDDGDDVDETKNDLSTNEL